MKVKWLKAWQDNGHVALRTTISKVIITWMGCLKVMGIMMHQLRLEFLL